MEKKKLKDFLTKVQNDLDDKDAKLTKVKGADERKNVLNLKIPENIRGNMDVSIIDISGRNLISQRHNDNPGTVIINTADLKEGIYLVRVAHSSGTFSSKILKSK